MAKKSTKFSVGIFTVILFLLAASNCFSQAIGDYRSLGGNWGTAGNWERLNSLTPVTWATATGGQGYPGQNAVPGTVTIQNTHTVTLNVSPANAIGSLVIGGGASGILTVGNNGTARTLTMNGSVTVNVGATFQTGGTAAAHVINVGGNLTNSGTITLSTGGGATLLFTGGTNLISGTSATTTLYNLSVTGGTASFGDNTATVRTLNITNDFLISSGTFQSGNTAAVAHTINLTRNLTNNGGTLNFTANSATNHTFNFANAGAKAIVGTNTATATFYNLGVATGTVSFGDNVNSRTINISNDFIVTSGTFQSGSTAAIAHTINVTRNLTNNGGTLNLTANAATNHTFNFTNAGAKVIAGSNTATATFYNLGVATGTVSFGDNINSRTININNDFIVTSGTFQSGSTAAVAHTINLTRNLTNSGSFNLSANSATNHTLIFTGAGSKTISGSGSIAFQHVTMSTTGSAVVNANTNSTVNGTISWTTDGLLVVNASNDLTLGSAAAITSPGANRYIQLDGTSSATSQLLRVNNNTTAAWQFLFPVGTSSGGYTPLDLSVATITTAPALNSTLAVKAVVSSDATGRMKRTFRMIVAGNSNATTFSGGQFSYNTATDISSGDVQANYNTFWYQKESLGTWTALTGTAPGGTFFSGPTVAQSLANDTYYFTIGSAIAYGGNVWYSYQTGNWTDPTSWTTDGSLFPLYVNPTNAVPGAADNVVITSGRTIFMNVNGISTTSITVTGTLDVLASTGHNFTTISGLGRIKMSATTDNFPAGTATNFSDPAVGGTVEINGTGISLNQARTFNHMVVNMTGAADIATVLNSITLNGDLTVTNGLLRFNDNATGVNRTFTVNGDVNVAAAGGIRTGSANARHEFNLYGDFTNNGTSYFTNRTTATTSAEATDGIVDVNFLSATQDQQAICNGVTRFYRIEINKGTDDTYKVSISASASTNFNLFGAANYDINEATAAANGNGTNLNAIGLNFGTVEIGTNVIVPFLNTTGNYSIYQGARIWVNGGSITKTGGNAIVPYGVLRVSAGTVTVDEDRGLTLRDSGVILVEGGTVTVRCISTSTAGVSAVGSYIQSGGDVILTGNDVSDDYAVLSLTYTGNVFNMSGGNLRIQSANNLGTSNLRGVVFINSDPANVSITGGTVIFEADQAINYRITSRASFWNVIMRATGGTRTFELLGTTSGSGGGANEPSVAIQPLVALNDFTIESSATFTTNNANVTFNGNFDIQNGATYTHGTNTTTISGLGVSSLIFRNTSTTQTFNNLTISKTNSTDEVVINTGNATALQVNGTLTISKGIFDYSTFAASARGTVTLSSGGTVGKSTSAGRLLLDGTVDQTLNSSAAFIYNMELNNTDASPVITLATGNLTVLGTLTMTAGIFDINTLKLTLSGLSAAIAGSGFSTSKMIRTSANTSDSGLELYLDANETLTFPLGVATKYTPVTATFTGVSDDGLVKINPVNGILQTTDLTGGANILAYYWRVGSSNFSAKPSVSYTFTYETVDVGGTEANYVPGKVLDVSPFTRSFENDVTKVNDATNVITFNGSGSGFTLEDANYTAGGTGRFGGTVEVFYTRKLTDAYNQSWTDGTLWTFGANGLYGVHDSRQTSAGSSPGAGDIAVIGWVPFGDPTYTNGNPHGVSLAATQSVAEVRFTQMLDVSNAPTERVYFRNFQFRPTLCLNNNGGGNQGRLASGTKVSGEGMFWNRSTTGGNLSDPSFTGVDLGAFNLQDSSYMVYENTVGGATYVNMPSTLPNLMVTTDGWGANDLTATLTNTMTINGNFELLGDINLVMGTTATGDITVNRNLRFYRSNANGNDSGGGGEIRFGTTGTARTINILGDLMIGNGYAALISIPTPGTTPLTHTLNLYGDFVQNTTAGNGFKAGTSSTNDRIHVNLLGSTSMTLTNTAGDAPQFYSLTVNKGSSISTTASFDANFTINGPTNAATKSLVLTNGLFVINHASASVVLTSGGANFNIPSTSGLEVRLGAVSTTTTNTNANITLDGLLRVSGGTATIDSGVGFANYIEYSNSGNATIEVTGGTLTVGGQVRRGTSSATGVLKYTQSSGTVVIGNRGSLAATRGVFEVLNTGSQFNHSGGSFTLVRGNGSATVPSLWLEPASATITTGSTITIGNANTPAGNIGIQSTTTLNNLSISGLAGSAPNAKIYISPLTVNGNVTVATGNTLDAQGLDLNVGGDFTINGTYTSGNNITTFTNTSAAAISGTTPSLSFYNFTKTGVGTLTLSNDITINRDLKLSAGTLASASFAINLKRHAEIDATHTSTSGSGLIFNGTAQQQLTRSALGTGNLGIVTLNNSTGVIIPDGNGYDFAISNNLRLQSGVFDIGGSLISLGTAALITPVSSFSVTNMVQTNSSFTDKGIRKQFPTGYTTNFIFPVGQLTYTPVTFDFSTPGNTTGSSGSPTITVRPANERHPSIINDNGVGELPDPATFNDLNNVLQYNWIINADNVASTFRSTMTLQYVQSLVSVVTPYTEADFIAARILSDANPTILINKFSTADVNETSNTIAFTFTGVTDAGISGDYFAGVDVAIPDNVAIYTTTASGNVNAAVYTPVVPGGGAPSGALVVVQPGHTLTFNISSVSLYETQINAGGKIVISSGSIGHRLGVLSGTGDLQIDSNTGSAVLPAAVYDDFFSCAGGGLIFGGTGSYEILGGITILRNLTLNGTGNTVLANNDITICNDLTLSITGSGSMSNANNRLITINNDFLLNSGSYYNVAGDLNITRDFVETLGLFDGGTGGAKVIGRNLTINGGTFTSGSGTGTIRVNGNMSLAGGATFTGGSSSATGVRYIFQGSAAQTLTGNFTGTRFINRLDINNTAGLTLAGNVTVDRELLLTAGNITPGSNTFLLSSTAVSNPTEGRATSFVNGKLYKLISSAGSSFIFPIGKGSLWRPGSVNVVSNAGDTWDMEYFYAPATAEALVNNLTPVAPILRIAGGEYWKVSDGAAPAGRTAYVGLSWGVQSDVSANLAEREAMQVVAWNDGLTQWQNYGGTSFSPGGSHTQSYGSFISSSTLGFTENIVTLGSSEVANPLPVSFLDFAGTTENGINILNWSTASELNNDHFEIERSTDGERFEVIGRVDGKGTFNSLANYSLEDKDPIIGRNYYRLKQVDFDGKSAYHEKVIALTVEVQNNLLDFEVYPNPVTTGLVNLIIYKGNNESVQVRLLDMTGRIWLSSSDESRLVQLQLPNLSAGIYLIEISQGFRRKTHRLVIKN